MNETKGLALLLAASLACLCVAGCSESKQRKATKKLREEVQRAQELSEEARQFATRTTRVPTAGGETAQQRLDRQAAATLAQWIKAVPGRETVLIDQRELAETVAKWRLARRYMEEIRKAKEAGDRATANDYLVRLEGIRRSDLPPIPPATVDKMADFDWRQEGVKKEVVARLDELSGEQQAEARGEFFAALFEDLAGRALWEYAQGGPERLQILAVSDDQAQKMLAGWLGDAEAIGEILSRVSPAAREGVREQLRDKVKDALSDPDAAKNILGRLREGEPVVLPWPRSVDPEALDKLEEAHSALEETLKATGEADQETRKIAQSLLAQISRQQGRYYSVICGGVEDQTGYAIELGREIAHEMSARLDVMGAFRQPAPAGQAVKDAEAGVENARDDLENLKAEKIASLQRSKTLAAKATELAAKAGAALLEARAAENEQEHKEKLEAFSDLQAAANEAERSAAGEEANAKRKADEIKLAEIDLAEKEDLLRRAKEADEESRNLAERNSEQRQSLGVIMATSRRRLRQIITLTAESAARADENRSKAADLFDRAADEAKEIGKGEDAAVAMTLIRRGDLLARRLRLQKVTARLRRSLSELLGRPGADPDGAVKKHLDESLLPLLVDTKKLEGIDEEKYDEALQKALKEAPENLRAEAEEKYAEAADVCAEAMPSARGEAEAQLTGTLAAAYLARLRVAAKRDEVVAAAKDSTLGRYLRPEPVTDASLPMDAIRKLRAELGMKEVRVVTTRPAPGAAAAAAPREVITNMQSALVSGDKQAFVACFDVSGKEAEAIGIMFEFATAIPRFEKAMEDAYGPGVVRREEVVPALGSEWMLEKDLIGKTAFKVEGDKATGTVEGSEEKLEFVKKNGGWRLKLDRMQPGEADKALEVFKALNQAFQDALGKVGKAGYDADKINNELGQAVMEAMLKPMIEGSDEGAREEFMKEAVEAAPEGTERPVEEGGQEPPESPAP